MNSTLEALAAIFENVSGISASTVEIDQHIFDDLGIDSLDFLDIVFDIDKAFGIKMPIEEWLTDIEQDKVLGAKLFTVKNIVSYIDSAKVEA